MNAYIIFVLVLVTFRGPVAIEGFETRDSCEKELKIAIDTSPKLVAGGHCVSVTKRQR